MSTIGQDLLGMVRDPRLVVPCTNVIENNTYIGLEIELENLRASKSLLLEKLPYWDVHKESSLRGNYAYELVFKYPLAGKDILAAIRELNNLIIQLPGLPEKSDRQSVHVHLDVRDFSYQDLITFIYVYCIFERALYHYCSKEFDRINNPFCVPIWQWHTNMYLIDMLYGYYIYKINNGEEVRSVLSSVGRYSGFNLNSIIKFGTIEFRMHGPAYTEEELIPWINIILTLKKISSLFKSKYISFPKSLYPLTILDTAKNYLGDFNYILEYKGARDDLRQGYNVVSYFNIRMLNAMNGPILDAKHRFKFALGSSLFNKFINKDSNNLEKPIDRKVRLKIEIPSPFTNELSTLFPEPEPMSSEEEPE